MNTVILVHGPDFACSENLTQAFALRGKAHLVSLNDTDWRGYDPGLLLDAGTLDEARALVDEADLVLLGDAPALHCLARLGGPGWLFWANELPLAAFFGDSFYYRHPAYYDGILEAMGVARLFLLPNLIPLTDNLEAVPLHHPMPITHHEKTEPVSVMHAPGRDGKAVVKGTQVIETVVNRLLEEGCEFEYHKLMYLTLEECLAVKGTAHVVIDQLPPAGLPRGLGRSGLEALAAGSAVLTDLYPPECVSGFFPVPPAVPVHDPDELYLELWALLDDAGRCEVLGAESQAWAAEHVAFEPWLAYVERYL